MRERQRFAAKATLSFLMAVNVAFQLGCGGGTSGTTRTEGTGIAEKLINGVVSDSAGLPVVGAHVLQPGGGESVTTDSGGAFELVADLDSLPPVLEIAKSGRKESVSLPNVTDSLGVLKLSLEFDQESAVTSSYELVVRSIGGEACLGAWDQAKIINFSNSDSRLVVVNQILPLASGTTCIAEALVLKNGARMAGVGAEIYSIDPLAPWLSDLPSQQLVSAGSTDSSGEVSLPFIPDSLSESRFFVIEVPVSQGRSERVGVVLNPLRVQ